MKAALGGVSADGIGTPEFDVPQSGGGPCAFVVIQSGGNGTGASAAQPTSSGEVGSPVRWPIAREELITAAANATAETVPIANVVAVLIEHSYHFVVAVWREKDATIPCVKRYWEIIADTLLLKSQSHVCSRGR